MKRKQKQPLTYAELLAGELRCSQGHYFIDKKPTKNYEYQGMIIPSVRFVITDVLTRCAICCDKSAEYDPETSRQRKLAEIFHEWTVDEIIPIQPVAKIKNEYARELAQSKCVMDVLKAHPAKNLRTASPLYSFYFAYIYLMMFFWEAGFIRNDKMTKILKTIVIAKPIAILSGEVQRVFLKLASSWCRDAFEDLKNLPSVNYDVDESLEKTILKAYFSINKFDFNSMLNELWADELGQNDYTLMFIEAENRFLTEMINAQTMFISESSEVLNRIDMHTKMSKYKGTIKELNEKLVNANEELEETKKRARKSEKELNAVKDKQSSGEGEKYKTLKDKIKLLENEKLEFENEMKASKLELELNNHKKSKYAEKIKLLEKQLEDSENEKNLYKANLEEVNKLNKDLQECIKEFDGENEVVENTISEDDKKIAENCRYTLIVPPFIISHVKKRLPNCRIVDVDMNANFDIGKTKAVFLCTACISHSQVWRANSQAEHSKVPVIMVNSTGVNNLVNQVVKYHKEVGGATYD